VLHKFVAAAAAAAIVVVGFATKWSRDTTYAGFAGFATDEISRVCWVIFLKFITQIVLGLPSFRILLHQFVTSAAAAAAVEVDFFPCKMVQRYIPNADFEADEISRVCWVGRSSKDHQIPQIHHSDCIGWSPNCLSLACPQGDIIFVPSLVSGT
jgi:hypothetical protein